MYQGKRWEFVRSNIEEAIASSRFRPREKLPNDVELALEYGVNRHTVRSAIRALEQEGLLRVEQGRGTFVVEHPRPYLLSPQTRLTDNLISQGRLAGRKILSAATIKADERLAGYFDLQARDDVLRIDTELSGRDPNRHCAPLLSGETHSRTAGQVLGRQLDLDSSQAYWNGRLLAAMGDDKCASALCAGGAPP
ncbi:regulatory protein, gntR family [Bradyrhizobium arachidis]|uniref:GntR family transcriptional regulator n=1 Tax=Bradyrhizobium arachidis TaxID=858423 RepID=A0AAE7NJR5_9BRAD|nr:GntR family transcriptional regulator [Bradyrhizobium arachidis]QOZ66681.1 GntR family transcriptional regulator [Bradyrhizobium arachidis]SFV14901.1 regulatory protein, gntR family [Bradyrhizobium arachidis]